ncbi:uncharacterized protein AB9X84_008369 [Acanthopagrus schlegelii]
MFPLSAGYIAGGFGELGTAEQLKTQSPGFKSTMASARCCWTALFLLSVVTCGVYGRAVDTQGFVSRVEPSGQTLRTDALRRWRRAAAGTHRERCAELTAPWQENTRAAPDDDATRLQLRVRPFTPRAAQGLVFPEKSLFSFVRRVYHCCQEGLSCRSLKGIQGRLRGDTDVEFLLTRDVWSLTVMRAELHLLLSNPQHLDIHPVLSALAKRDLPTRYSVWSRSGSVELRVDLLFLFQSLQEAAGEAGGGPSLANMRRVASSSEGDRLQDTAGGVWGDEVTGTLPVQELGLVLGCSRAGSRVSCGAGGVRLSHTPFMALYHR